VTRHFIKIILSILIISFLIFLPYFPGDYDEMATILSAQAQVLGITALLLVPVGIVWLIYELVQRNKDLHQASKIRYRFAIIVLIISCLIGLATTITGFASSPTLGFITLVVYIYLFIIFLRWIKRGKETKTGFNPVPFYLIFIPAVVAFLRFMFIDTATEFSRLHAIKNSEPLIRDIEAYHVKNGHYPISLLSLWEDYKPSVIGIKRFYYEPYGNSYNLYFEQFSGELGIKEIVMYNKLDEQEFSSHNSDLLLLSPEQIKLQRGYISVHDLPKPHWKYFWFD